jgi:hypothetical protein
VAVLPCHKMLTTHFLRSASTGWLDLATVSFARYDGVQELREFGVPASRWAMYVRVEC